MKLRNKETGGLANLIVDKDLLRVKTNAGWQDYNSLAELNEDWEDYEEPKEYWFIAGRGVVEHELDTDDENDPFVKGHKEMGNYFKTKEEAEKAVEKLKAWKRLKEKGFEFKRWTFEPDLDHVKGNFITIEAEMSTIMGNMNDLDLLFETTEESSAIGGENE